MNVTYQNIESNSAVELFNAFELKEINIKSINMCNTDDAVTNKVSLYLSKIKHPSEGTLDIYGRENTTETTTTYYLIKDVSIPAGTTLQLDSSDICIDYTSNDCKLSFQSSNAAGKIDLIIKTTSAAGGSGTTQNNY
tara:strand:- start:4224 stop:4634 length:411 start_codon:yes stop_codon:yes gene_type:complete